jgi:hypothetical protein
VIFVLLPRAEWGNLVKMRSARYCVLSRGSWSAERIPDALEVMFEDGSNAPLLILLTPENFGGLLPGPPPADQEWSLAVWTEKDGKPCLTLEKTCYWRRVKTLPCAQPWILKG